MVLDYSTDGHATEHGNVFPVDDEVQRHLRFYEELSEHSESERYRLNGVESAH